MTTWRHGDCPPSRRDAEGRLQPSTDQAVAAYLKARGMGEVDPFPADWARFGDSAGPRRNREMLDGRRQADLFGTVTSPPADLLVHFRGGRGTADCTGAALERGLPVEFVVDADEPRPWNVHHGTAPGPSIYIGRSREHGGPSPLANPVPLELRDGETRTQAAPRLLEQYRRWLWAQLRDPRSGVRAALKAITPEHYLVCSCWPRHCHAEIVIAAWRSPKVQGLIHT